MDKKFIECDYGVTRYVKHNTVEMGTPIAGFDTLETALDYAREQSKTDNAVYGVCSWDQGLEEEFYQGQALGVILIGRVRYSRRDLPETSPFRLAIEPQVE